MPDGYLYTFSGDHLELDEIDRHYRMVARAIRLYYSERNPGFRALFQDYTRDAIQKEMRERLDEHDLTMSMSVLSALEAAFRIDYSIRCRRRMKDGLSRDFRDIFAERGVRVSFRKHILSAWARHSSGIRKSIGELKKSVDYRNWLAHGRYWVLETGGKYDYRDLYTIANAIMSGLPLQKFR